MFEDYREVVFAAYKEKKEKGTLSPNLQLPSPAKLKAECMLVYKERLLPKDQDTLRAFFGARNDSNDYSLHIKNIDIDRFRPLVNFLKGASKPDHKIVELLAWLLDFNPRPYASWNKVPLPDESLEIIREEIMPKEEGTLVIPDTVVSPDTISEENKALEKTANPNIKGAVICLIAGAAVMFCSYIFYQDNRQQCMYWTGERYQKAACDFPIENSVLVALDTFKLARVKKITRLDTLSTYSIRKVFYAKTNGVIEFYTDSSDHPTDRNKRMLPMTKYIYDKYIPVRK